MNQFHNPLVTNAGDHCLQYQTNPFFRNSHLCISITDGIISKIHLCIYDLYIADGYQHMPNNIFILLYQNVAQSAGAVEYTDCFSAEG